MGCTASKSADADCVIDHRYDERGNLIITRSTSSGGDKNNNNNGSGGLKLSMNKGSGSKTYYIVDSNGDLDVSSIPTQDLLSGNNKHVRKDKPERLFLLLDKALNQERKPKSPGGGIDPDMLDDLTTERQSLYVAVIDQIQREENSSSSKSKQKQNNASSAQYVHPTSKQTPLHLACRLVDVDQNQISAKELCRVMDALLRTYPQALTCKDLNGHVPLHYAVAPNHFYVDHINAKITTTTDGSIVVTKSKSYCSPIKKSIRSNDDNNDNNNANSNEEEEKKDDGNAKGNGANKNDNGNNNDGDTNNKEDDDQNNEDDVDREDEDWRARAIFVQHLFHSNLKAAHEFWQQSDVVYDSYRSYKDGTNQKDLTTGTGGCSPLYRVLQTIPDDFDRSGPTVDYIKVLLQASYSYSDDDDEDGSSSNIKKNDGQHNTNNNNNNNNMAGIGNASDGDKPLGLLYRRFTRQFDISEMFFPGDNSRPEVVKHREKYKYAAGNTWKIIEALLKPPAQYMQDFAAEISQSGSNCSAGTQQSRKSQQQSDWGLVHRAVQMETPPDLLRYIVETNAQDLTTVDADGNLPLHYAAMVKPPKSTISGNRNFSTRSTSTSTIKTANTTHFPSFYTKYVVDELLYKFPEAAAMKNSDGKFPLTLAVTSGKQWIGGGIKSLYDAYPKALQQIDLKQKHHQSLRQVLSMGGDNDNDEKYDDEGKLVGETDNRVDIEKATSDEKLLKQVTTTASGSIGINPTGTESDDTEGIIKDEHHDAIMLVQQPDVDFREVSIAMWAHEEDAGVQMLGCCAIVRLLDDANKPSSSSNDDGDDDDDYIIDGDTDEPAVSRRTLRMALSATASVVNAMKAHPNEMIVQEKACAALQLLAPADGRREVSMVASGAVASIVAAMQAHVGDASVQEEACAAIGAICRYGGGDRATVVASVSGVTAILNAIAAHPRDVKVQKEGLNALWQLTNFNENDASMPELPRAQTEPLLSQAKINFPNECNELVTKLSERMKV